LATVGPYETRGILSGGLEGVNKMLSATFALCVQLFCGKKIQAQRRMKTLIPLLLAVIAFGSVASAQSKKDKIEIGVQSTSLTLFHPDFPFDDVQTGVGGRFTFNFNRSIAAEAEVNFFPQRQIIFTAEGNAIQAQFGVQAG
jgi:hypothetical protein